VIVSLAFKRQGEKFTISRFAVGIGHPRGLIGAFVPVAEGGEFNEDGILRCSGTP
jgi:hypothetical protein